MNFSSLAGETGVSAPTIASWLSVLEASFLVYRLKPWFSNLSKRVVKSPKIYFAETGLATHLLGIRAPSQLAAHLLLPLLFLPCEPDRATAVHDFYELRFFHLPALGILFYQRTDGNPVAIAFRTADFETLLFEPAGWGRPPGGPSRGILPHGPPGGRAPARRSGPARKRKVLAWQLLWIQHLEPSLPIAAREGLSR